jgi:AcrR family transcriptional regulator
MNRPDTRQLLLDAAERVVQRDGVGKLTLDAVAQEAGVSKGGVLYHFRTKHALIEGMVLAQMDAYESEQRRREQADPHPVGRRTRAYILASFSESKPKDSNGAGMIAAIANDPQLMGIIQARFTKWQAEMLNDGLDAVTATLIRLATDGLWFAQLFATAPPPDPLRQEVIARLVAMTENPLT